MTTVKRTHGWNMREYDREKWTEILDLVHAERARLGPSATLPRVLACVERAGLASTPLARADLFARVPSLIAGVPVETVPAVAQGAHRGLVAETVVRVCAPDVELVVELGSGWSRQLLSVWNAGGPAAALYVGAELTPTGRACADALAALDPALCFRSLDFDFTAPDLSSLRRVRSAVVFTVHGVQNAPDTPVRLLDEIIALADRVTCVHFEPVGWQLGSEAGSSIDYALQHDYNRDLVATLRAGERDGRLRIEQVVLDAVGLNPRDATSVVAWRSTSAGERRAAA